MVGGCIIQIAEIAPGVSELWCVDRHGTEAAVKVKAESEMPALGSEIWWQAGKVYWDNDRRTLDKIANSYAKD